MPLTSCNKLKPNFHLATLFARRGAKTRIRQRDWLKLTGKKIRREQVGSVPTFLSVRENKFAKWKIGFFETIVASFFQQGVRFILPTVKYEHNTNFRITHCIQVQLFQNFALVFYIFAQNFPTQKQSYGSGSYNRTSSSQNYGTSQNYGSSGRHENDEETLMRNLFSSFDIGRDGRISQAEFLKILSSLGYTISYDEVSPMVNAFDQNGDGEMDFQSKGYQYGKEALENKIRKAFRYRNISDI